MVVVRLWAQADIDFVAQSVQREGWGHTRRDVERCWQFEPNGCFVAEVEGRPVGHVFSVSYCKVGWIGLLIVNPESRGKGIGTILMRAAIDYLRKEGIEAIWLEAVEKAVPLYKRLGFKEEFESIRFFKQLKPGKEPRHAAPKNMLRVRERDLDNIARFDSKYFGVSRLRVLKSLYEDQPQRCFVSKERQKLLGYIMCRKISNAYWIGPWVCEDSEVAWKLLQTCIDAIMEGTESRLGMPVLNSDGIRVMQKLDFQLKSRSLRMFLGKRKRLGDISGIYGIGGAEKG